MYIIFFYYGFPAMFYAILLSTIDKMEFKNATTSYFSLKQFVSTSPSSLKRLFPLVGRVIKDIALIIRDLFSDLAYTITIGMVKYIKWAGRHDDRLQAACDDRSTVNKRNFQRKEATDTCFMMKTARSYNGRTYPECPPYHGARGQAWNTFCQDFASAMSIRDLANDSLEETLYGTDVGGDRWIDERHPDIIDANGIWHQGNLVRLNGANPMQAHGHARRATSTCSAISTRISQIHD